MCQWIDRVNKKWHYIRPHHSITAVLRVHPSLLLCNQRLQRKNSALLAVRVHITTREFGIIKLTAAAARNVSKVEISMLRPLLLLEEEEEEEEFMNKEAEAAKATKRRRRMSIAFLPYSPPSKNSSTSRPPLKICMQRRFIDFSSYFRSQTAFVSVSSFRPPHHVVSGCTTLPNNHRKRRRRTEAGGYIRSLLLLLLNGRPFITIPSISY